MCSRIREFSFSVVQSNCATLAVPSVRLQFQLCCYFLCNFFCNFSIRRKCMTTATQTKNMHRIVIVGGGAGGLELATRLGDKLGRRKRALVTLVDKSRTHLWKP